MPAPLDAGANVILAISAPLAELDAFARSAPKRKAVVAYCRGHYCVFALDAVKRLRRRGIDAMRLEDGISEWRMAGLSPRILDKVLAEARAEVARQLEPETVDGEAIEREIATLKKELRNLVQLGAAGGEEFPELVAAMQDRQRRIQQLDTELALTRRTPELVAQATARMEAAIRARMADIRKTLAADAAGSRDLYRMILPDGLTL